MINLWMDLLIFGLGACAGSFLNVCIYRMPLNKSVVFPGSHCAACGCPIPWYYNIPIISWFVLKGKATCCGSRIDARYALVEALTALGFFLLWMKYPPILVAVYAFFFCGLVIATFVDLDHFIIPDEISLGGCVFGIVLSALVPELHHTASIWTSVKASVIGFLVGGVGLFAIAIGGMLILRKEAMGMGDVKLMAAMGAFLGWQAPLFILPVASCIGSVCGIAILLRKGKMLGVRIPFGPYLALAAMIWIFGGNVWMEHYLAAI